MKKMEGGVEAFQEGGSGVVGALVSRKSAVAHRCVLRLGFWAVGQQLCAAVCRPVCSCVRWP